MSTHTPGPWKAREVYDLPSEQVDGKAGHDYPGIIIHRDDDNIPSGVCCLFNITGQTRANARLIAAAPQLLEALKAIRTLYEAAANSNGEVFLDESEIGRIAETALAAAQGKD